MTTRKSRYDMEAFGKMDTNYVPMEAWEYDQIHGALKPVDAVARDMEVKWGVGRLQELVSPETAAKFEAARAKLDVAIHDNNVALVIKRASIMERGWKALEKEAIDAGHKPAPPEIWFAHAPEEDGQGKVSFAIAKDNTAATLAQTDVPVYTVQEIARIVRAWRSEFDSHHAKKVFPGAEVVSITGEEIFEDEIPF